MDAEPQRRAPVAGMLLTGGRSRRMGFDKATIVIDGVRGARRTAQVLRAVASPVLEIGPGVSGLPAVREEPLGAGPLVAVSSGFQALEEGGYRGPALVLACDLPMVTLTTLRMLAGWPTDGSIVPVVDGWPQPLCARWSAVDLAAAAELVHAGERSMQPLVARPNVVLLDETTWPSGVVADDFGDADTPADLDRLGLLWRPGTGGARQAGP